MRKILVVDDDVDLLLILKTALRANGYEVVTLDGGLQLLEKIQELKPDLIVLDINMGEWDGTVICNGLKKIPVISQIPIILFSGENKKRADDCKADAFIQKPISTNFFLKKVRQFTAA